MEPCARCAEEKEELIVQPNGEGLCRNCHLGLGPGYDEDEYNLLRVKFDKDVEFKKLRHRFWALGLARRFKVLVHMGYATIGETLPTKIERLRLYKIKWERKDVLLAEFVEAEEREILAENEKSDFLAPKPDAKIEPSGKVHAGRVDLGPGNVNPNPWSDSQE